MPRKGCRNYLEDPRKEVGKAGSSADSCRRLEKKFGD